jgi:3-hydroxyisobutyrate dehydrogenase-like beta-hydroxyacid dehydrogenase
MSLTQANERNEAFASQGECANTEPLFRAIARQHFHLGPSGSGTTMKLVVNTLLGVGMEAIAEAGCA